MLPITLLLAVALGALSGTTHAAAPDLPKDAQPRTGAAERRAQDADDLCRELMNAAASTAAPLRWPRVFSRFGVMRGTPIEVDGAGATRRGLLWNLQVGVEVSPTRMLAGGVIEDRARAECRRSAAELGVRALEAGLALDASSALDARAAALSASLPAAEARLAESATRLEAGHASASMYAAVRRRVARLREAAAAAELEASRAPRPEPAPYSDTPHLFASLLDAEARASRLDGSLRQISGLDLTLRAGYDEVFGIDQSVPIFAFASVQLSPARLVQGSLDAKSDAARVARVERRLAELRRAIDDFSARLMQQLDLVERRLVELDAGVHELATQQAELERVGTSAARELLHELWFDRVELDADRGHRKSARAVNGRARHGR